MARRRNNNHHEPADELEAEFIPLTPEEEKEIERLVEKPNYRFAGGLYVNGYIVPDHIPPDPYADED